MITRIQQIESAMLKLYEYLYLLQGRPTEHIEAVWREKVVLELEDICSMARQVDSIIFSRKCNKLKIDLLKLPNDIRRFMELKGPWRGN